MTPRAIQRHRPQPERRAPEPLPPRRRIYRLTPRLASTAPAEPVA